MDEERVLKIFRVADEDGNGTISSADMTKVLVGVGFRKSQAQAAFIAADTDQDGKVDYEDFVAWAFGEDVLPQLQAPPPLVREVSQRSLGRARASVEMLKRRDVTNLRALARPPAGVQEVVVAVALLLRGDLPRAETRWQSATKVLADRCFLDSLQNIDVRSVRQETYEEVVSIIEGSGGKFSASVMSTRSVVCASLVKWVVNIKDILEKEGIVQPVGLASLPADVKVSLSAAEDHLSTMNVRDIQELKSLRKPPRDAENIVFAALLLLRNRRPSEVPRWKACQVGMANIDEFFASFFAFNPSLVSQDIYDDVVQIIAMAGGEFSVQAMSVTSAIARWVIRVKDLLERGGFVTVVALSASVRRALLPRAKYHEDDEDLEADLAAASFRFTHARDNFFSAPWSSMDAEVKADSDARRDAKIAAIRKAVVDYLIELGETANSADRVFAFIEQNNPCSLSRFTWQGVDSAAVDGFRHKAACNYRKAIEDRFPEWQLTPSQKAAVIDEIVRTQSLGIMMAAQGQSLYEDALMGLRDSTDFQCPICMEPLVSLQEDGSVDVSRMWLAPYRRTEHWSNQPCGHACCRTCMSRWAETAINDRKGKVVCPAPGCSYSLWDQDIIPLVSNDIFLRHKEHKSADYSQHLKASLEDKALSKWLKEHSRPCPDCHVVVSRSEGCDMMICVCGAHFCYGCGFAKCKCRQHNRPDIWNIA